tara:strand:+ start:14872 stop:15699 length:828 start_codon:yes stop_codon:yes gene_type:complete
MLSGGLRTRNSFKSSNENNPLITIVTVVYNGVEFIENTIRSVIGQKCDNVEYIIVDGASTDGTLELIKKYDNEIDYWISGKDSGIYDAMNKGISLSTGKWVNFMNCGDTFISDTVLSEMNYILKSYNHSIVSGNVRIVSREGVFTGLKHPYAGSDYNQLLAYNCVAHQACFVSKTVYDLLDGFESGYKIHGDYEFWIRAMISSIDLIYVDKDIAFFSNDGISSNRKNVPIAIRERYYILNKYGLMTSVGSKAYTFCSITYYYIKTFIRFLINRKF